MTKPIIIPVPFALSDYGKGSASTYNRIISVSSANDTMEGLNESNLLQKNCRILDPIKYESFEGDENNDSPYKFSAHSMQKNLANKIANNLVAGTNTLVLGGDHTISIGSGLGLSKMFDMKKIGLLYIDQHGDCNTPESSMSKCLTGYPVAVVTGRGDDLFTKSFNGNFIKKVAYIGIRDVDEPEMEIFNQIKPLSNSAIDVEIKGIIKCIHESIEYFKDCDYIWLSIDIDSLDNSYLEPGETDVPAPGGLTPRELLTIAYLVETTGKLLITEITQLNDLGKVTDTTVLASRVSEICLGLGKFRYGVN